VTKDSSSKEGTTASSSLVFLHPSSALFQQGSLGYRVLWMVCSIRGRCCRRCCHQWSIVYQKTQE